MSYQKISVKIFGNLAESVSKHFHNMRSDLITAGIRYPLKEYISMGFLTVTITFFFSLILLSLFFGVIAPTPLMGFFTAFTSSMFLTILSILGFYIYPSFVTANRKKKIDISIPFATTYMATISGSGAPPKAVFELMAEFEEYGEFSKEVRKIVRDMKVFGYDLETSIRKTMRRTPSENFRDLMQGVISSISSGSDLTNYLQTKSKTYMTEYQRTLTEYSKQLSLFVEVYLTLIIVGSIFFMVLSTIMSAISLSGSLITMQFIIIFMVMPFISIGFIYLLKATSPTEA